MHVLHKKGTPNQIGNVSRTGSVWCPRCITPLYVTGWHPVSCCPGDAPKFQRTGTWPRDLWPTLGVNFLFHHSFQHKQRLSSRVRCIHKWSKSSCRVGSWKTKNLKKSPRGRDQPSEMLLRTGRNGCSRLRPELWEIHVGYVSAKQH